MDRTERIQRLREMAAECWTLGFSDRSLAAVYAAFGVQICCMTAWWDVQAIAGSLQQQYHHHEDSILTY